MLIERDYILRLIRQIALVVAALFRFRKRGEVAEALKELHAAYGRLFQPLGGALAQMDAASVIQLLDDPVQLLGLGRLLHEEAELMNMKARPLEAAELEGRARELAAEALRRAPDLSTVEEVADLLWFDQAPGAP